LIQASTFQQIGKSVSCPSRGPLGVASWLQRLSNRSPSAVLESWNSLTIEQKLQIENPSSDWLISIRKKPELQTHIDIVSTVLLDLLVLLVLIDMFRSGAILFPPLRKIFLLLSLFPT